MLFSITPDERDDYDDTFIDDLLNQAYLEALERAYAHGMLDRDDSAVGSGFHPDVTKCDSSSEDDVILELTDHHAKRAYEPVVGNGCQPRSFSASSEAYRVDCATTSSPAIDDVHAEIHSDASGYLHLEVDPQPENATHSSCEDSARVHVCTASTVSAKVHHSGATAPGAATAERPTTASTSMMQRYLLDTCCSEHMCNHKAAFETIHATDRQILPALQGNPSKCGIGTVKLVTSSMTGRFELSLLDCLYSPDLRANLLSLPRMKRDGYRLVERHGAEILITPNGNEIPVLLDTDGFPYLNCAPARHAHSFNVSSMQPSACTAPATQIAAPSPTLPTMLTL